MTGNVQRTIRTKSTGALHSSYSSHHSHASHYLLRPTLALCGLLPLVGCVGRATPPGVPSQTAPAPAAVSPRDSLRREIEAIFADPDFACAFWGVRVESLDGDVLVDINGGKRFMPASNMKVFTTAAALDLLGPDFRYETRLEARGEITPDGVLHGDLVMIGSGDPSFGSWHVDDADLGSAVALGAWAKAVKDAGIREIDGRVIGDGRVFTTEFYSDGWEISDTYFWYACGTSGLAVEENCFRFTTAPGDKIGDPARITLNPQTAYVTLVNDTVTTVAGGPKDADIVWRGTDSNVIHFGGTVPIDAQPFTQRGSIWNAERYAATLFAETLAREGVPVRIGAANIRDIADAAQLNAAQPVRMLARYTSPPLSEQVRIVNKPSHNFFADQLLRTMGARLRGDSTFRGGARVVRDWLERIGAPEPEAFQMQDGSGLSRRDYVEPRQVTALLRYMQKSERLRDVFFESLPIAGVDGDLKSRMKDAPTRGNVHAKTGGISQARSLSGRVTDADGRVWLFSMIVNMHATPMRRADERIDRACALLANHKD